MGKRGSQEPVARPSLVAACNRPDVGAGSVRRHKDTDGDPYGIIAPNHRHMECIVTAGPTFEPIDKVRRITNFSTGTLGSGLAQHLAKLGHQVRLLLGEMATCPAPANVHQVIRFSTTASLSQILKGLATPHVEAVFHAAAVSDFAPVGLWSRSISGDLQPVKAGKVSSQISSLWIELAPTPKIIENLRRWFPKAVIVGWKYEVDGDRATALAQARDQIAKYATTACVVNGPAYGPGYALVDVSGRIEHFDDNLRLYTGLAQLIRKGLSSVSITDC